MVCEATGGYERRLLEQLHQARGPVWRLQPSQIHETMKLHINFTAFEELDAEGPAWLGHAYD